MTRVVFLHGLESGPHGTKAAWLRARYDLVAPALDVRSIDAALDSAKDALAGPVDVVVGSSFGGAVLLEAMHRGLYAGPSVFLAQAGVKLTERRAIPGGEHRVVLVHGLGDDVVPVDDSRALALGLGARAWLVELHDGHRLASVLEDGGVLPRSIDWALGRAG